MHHSRLVLVEWVGMGAMGAVTFAVMLALGGALFALLCWLTALGGGFR